MAPSSDKSLSALLGTQIRQARVRAGLTQEQAAKRAGMHNTQWNRYERGDRPIPLHRLKLVEKVLGTTLTIPDVGGPPPAPPELPADYYRAVLDVGRRVMAFGQALADEGIAGLTPSPERIEAADEARTVRTKGQAGKQQRKA